MISKSKLCLQPFSSSFVELTWNCYLMSKWILFLPIYWSYRSPRFCSLLSVYQPTKSEHGVQSLVSTFLFGVRISQIEMNVTILTWFYNTTRADECSGLSFVIQACFHLFIYLFETNVPLVYCVGLLYQVYCTHTDLNFSLAWQKRRQYSSTCMQDWFPILCFWKFHMLWLWWHNRLVSQIAVSKLWRLLCHAMETLRSWGLVIWLNFSRWSWYCNVNLS